MRFNTSNIFEYVINYLSNKKLCCFFNNKNENISHKFRQKKKHNITLNIIKFT